MRKSTIAIPALLMLLGGCVTAATDCPSPKVIPSEIQAQAASELAALPPDSALGKVLSAALDDRDKLRACRNIRK